MTDRLLTAREVAELLDVSAETILRWTRRGLLPALKLPSGAIRYQPERLDAWLQQQAVGADEECEQPDAPTATRDRTATRLRTANNPDPEDGIANEED